MNIPRPLEDRVVVQVDRSGPTKRGSLYLPATGKDDAPVRGVVLAVGPGVPSSSGRLAPDVLPDDVVLIPRFLGSTFMLEDGRELLIVRASEILAVL